MQYVVAAYLIAFLLLSILFTYNLLMFRKITVELAIFDAGAKEK